MAHRIEVLDQRVADVIPLDRGHPHPRESLAIPGDLAETAVHARLQGLECLLAGIVIDDGALLAVGEGKLLGAFSELQERDLRCVFRKS